MFVHYIMSLFSLYKPPGIEPRTNSFEKFIVLHYFTRQPPIVTSWFRLHLAVTAALAQFSHVSRAC